MTMTDSPLNSPLNPFELSDGTSHTAANGSRGRFVRAILFVAAAMSFAAGIAISAQWSLTISQMQRGMSFGEFAWIFLPAILGILLGAMLLGLSTIIGLMENPVPAAMPVDDVRPSLERLEESLRLLNSAQSKQAETAAVAPAPLAASNGTNLVPLLETLRDLTLMSDDQRQRFATRHWLRRRELLTDVIERNVLVGDWPAAFARLEDLQLLMPDDPQVNELRERVESEQVSRLEEDMRVARSRFGHLVSIAAWPQAEELAASLQRKYPGKTEPAQLADDIARARDAYERENMERTFRDISVATDRRQWRVAIQKLEEFIRLYPTDQRAQVLRLDLPMLKENAAAHERKEQEESFKDLLKRQRYEEAIAVARSVIQKYPNSASATEMNKLMPRVDELRRQATNASQIAIAGAFIQPGPNGQ